MKGPASPFDILRELVSDLVHGSLPFGNLASGFGALAILAFILCIPSVVIAWVVQCIVVIVRTKLQDRKRQKVSHVA